MAWKLWLALVSAALGITVSVGSVAGQESPASSWCEHHRAGHPQTVSRWAVPSDTGAYVGYYVGGGCVFKRKADPPCPDDGTWGWDYSGCLLPRRIILGWWHGRRYQGGTGAYKTDGPKVLGHVEENGPEH